MSAPSATMRTPASTARSTSKCRPPSANESGVMLRMPITRVRAPRWSGSLRGRGTVKERRGAIGGSGNLVIGGSSFARATARAFKCGREAAPARLPPYPITRFPIPRLFLGERLVERRNLQRTLLRGLPRGVGDRGRRRLRLVRLERFATHDASDLVGVEHFTHEELLGDAIERNAVFFERRLGALVVRRHEALDLVIDPDRGVFAVVLVLRDLAAEEDLLFLLAERQRPHRVAHAPLADHLAREFGRALEVVAGAGGHAAAGEFLGETSAEQDRDL